MGENINMMDFDSVFNGEPENENDFNPYLTLLMCNLLKEDLALLNDRIDITTKPTYFFINEDYFYNILLALHANENVRFIKKHMKRYDLVHVVERDTYLKMTGGKDID